MPPVFKAEASAEDAEGRLSILEVTVALPIPRHVHHHADECVYLLAGEVTVDIEDETRTAGGRRSGVTRSGGPERPLGPATARMADALIEGLTVHRALDTEPHDPAAVAEAVRRTTAYQPP
jgi:hypothetical protein